jgi:uncharacterized C2H2 Zn-finger protein
LDYLAVVLTTSNFKAPNSVFILLQAKQFWSNEDPLSFPSVSEEPFGGSSVSNQHNVTNCSRNSKVVPHCESNNQIVRCEICHVQVSSSDSLSKHNELCYTKHVLPQKRKIKEVPTGCPFTHGIHCKKSVKTKCQFKKRLGGIKCPKSNTKLPSLTVLDLGKDSNPISKGTCELCGYFNISSFLLRRHLFYTHQQKDNAKFVCKECGEPFFEITDLKRHSGKHSDDKPHACSQCHQSFKTVVNLKKHKLHRHQETKKCKFCQESFKTGVYLYRHHELTHPKEAQQVQIDGLTVIQCQFCSKMFGSQAALYTHSKKSHGVKKWTGIKDLLKKSNQT